MNSPEELKTYIIRLSKSSSDYSTKYNELINKIRTLLNLKSINESDISKELSEFWNDHSKTLEQIANLSSILYKIYDMLYIDKNQLREKTDLIISAELCDKIIDSLKMKFEELDKLNDELNGISLSAKVSRDDLKNTIISLQDFSYSCLKIFHVDDFKECLKKLEKIQSFLTSFYDQLHCDSINQLHDILMDLINQNKTHNDFINQIYQFFNNQDNNDKSLNGLLIFIQKLIEMEINYNKLILSLHSIFEFNSEDEALKIIKDHSIIISNLIKIIKCNKDEIIPVVKKIKAQYEQFVNEFGDIMKISDDELIKSASFIKDTLKILSCDSLEMLPSAAKTVKETSENYDEICSLFQPSQNDEQSVPHYSSKFKNILNDYKMLIIKAKSYGFKGDSLIEAINFLSEFDHDKWKQESLENFNEELENMRSLEEKTTKHFQEEISKLKEKIIATRKEKQKAISESAEQQELLENQIRELENKLYSSENRERVLLKTKNELIRMIKSDIYDKELLISLITPEERNFLHL